MTDVRLSDHALQRMAQRSIAISDVDLIMEIGTEVPDGFLVRRRDRLELEKSLKSLLNRLKRLEGKRLVVSDGCLITAYHAKRSEEDRLLRRDRHH